MSLVRAASFVLLPTLTLGAVILSGTAKPLRAAAASTPKAWLGGVMVNQVVDRESEEMPELAFQGTFAATKLALIVDLPSGGIIGVDRDASEVDSFADDTGRTYLDPDNPFGPFGFGERILRDGTRVALEMESRTAPSRTAETLSAAGTITLRTATEKHTATSKTGMFKEGALFDCGDRTFEILGAGPAQWGEGYEIEVRTDDDVDAIVRWWIVAPSGQEIELRPMSTMTFGTRSQITLVAERPVATGRIGIEAWHDPQTIAVSFDVSAAIGMR